MSFESRRDFRQDYPGGYVKASKVYDGNDKLIGYVTKDNVIRINDGSIRSGSLYHYDERNPKV